MKEPSYLNNELLSETCGLSISELEAMSARQARQLETQEQLLAAKNQRLRFLKSSGEAERLQRLREKVASQEERLRKLRALRGKVQSTRNGNSVLSADLESLRAVFNEKEKELSLAVAKVDELTRQLEDIRRNGKDQQQNGQSAAAMELEKLRRELMYRHKIRESQSNRVVNQKQALSQRQEEAMRVDRRIAELQERLHRKRILNSQLAASLKNQDNVEDFVSLPTKNDPKYQTLPYNARFAPFSNKHEQDQFEKSMQQMQIIQQDHSQYNRQQQNNQQQSNNHQQNNTTSSNNTTTSSNERIQSYNNRNNCNNYQQQLQNFLSQQQQQSNQQQQQSPNSINSTVVAGAVQQSSSSPVAASSSLTTTTTSTIPNGLQTVHSTQANNNVSKGKAVAFSANTSENTFPIVRPSNFLPTGAPASGSSNTSSSENGNGNSVPGNSVSGPPSNLPFNGSSLPNNSQSGNSQNDPANLSPVSGNGSDGFSSGIVDQGRYPKPALPPKPAKPTPPPRQAQEIFSFSQRFPSLSDGTMTSDKTELPLKSKALYLKNSHQQQQNTGSNSTSANNAEIESNGGSNNPNVRVSINRRIEMPPAFLFPESDPPPSDLIPEHPSSQSSSNSSGSDSRQQTTSNSSNSSGSSQVSQHNNRSPPGGDSIDASPLMLIKPMSNSIIAEEYTLPDLFPNPPSAHNNFPSHHHLNNNKGEQFNSNNNNLQNNQHNDQKHFNGPNSPNSALMLQHQQQQQQQSQGSENNKVDTHVSVMNIHVGPGSPRAVGGSEESGQMSNNSNQLEPFEAAIENRNTNDQNSERGDNNSDGVANSVLSNSTVPGVLRRVKKSNFKSDKRDHLSIGRRVSFDPLALLLDASLEGELDLVMKTANEVGNVSAANDEGITALHNAICAGHADVVRFLVEFGCDVNAQDSDGWTPLHCAASCNNVGMVKFLVEHGACIFATTLSDQETAAQKCEEDEDGFGPCSEYLYSIQEKLGIMNNGVVFSVFDYDAQNQDELNFRDGERLVILRKGDEYEREWWWAAITDKQGYVPRNLLGLYPRVVPQKRNDG